ncbi:NACHT and TPR domain protein [Aspergillus homomorphus CBS 101889]|uniref:NACHT and TPR domain protein n=1 Tax=Aspergillus homomorphus (strain CBS 101889) TaxID=1450537 RepID=A0A395HNF9_ASPHC|nr:NACHT and TPR domain protein [Aspergillus homomorphus CBS 101889]RAL07814.1 NACHT and TPR domain protein [Aspergillus homomorphus CBS 101889]
MAGPKNQIPAIYDRAIQKYREITDETLDVEVLASIRSVNDLISAIDVQNAKFSEFREKRGVLFDVLKAALVPVELFGNLAAGGAAMVFAPSSLVFGAVTYLMGAAKGVSTSYDAIQGLMGTLKDFTIRLKAYSQEAISDALSDKLADILVTLLEIFALATKAIRRGRLLKFTRNILLGSNDAIQAAMGKLDKLTSVEARLVGAETLTESKRTGRVVDELAVTVTSTNATVTETGMTVQQMSYQVTEVQEMLSTLVVSAGERAQDGDKTLHDLVAQILRPSKTDYAQDWYEKINKARIPGTGDWVRHEGIFQSWLRRDTPVIFVSGNPGAGKSYLSTNIISLLREQYTLGTQSTSLVSVGYFFFKDDNPDTRSIHAALRDLAFQISKSDPVYQRHIASVERYEMINSLESAWRRLFVDYFLKKPNVDGRVYILLDAVDEASDEERKRFLGLAKDLYDSPHAVRLQLAIVGRPHISDQLLEGLEVEVPTIHVTTQKNSDDINQYIHASIKKSVVLRRVSAKLRQEIVEKLSAGAEGMFLWVNLMLQELVKKRNESSMRKALDDPPKGLKEILRHVLANFSMISNEEELEYLNEILQWVACSQQPLTLGLVDDLLRLKSPEGDGMIYLEGALRRQFASFFSLDREDSLTTAELQNISTKPGIFDASDDEADQSEEAFEDVDNFTDFNSDLQTTTVTFCHAFIGDFFRDETEGKVSAREDHLAVGVNYREAKAHVLKTLLRLFADSTLADKANDSIAMLTHAAQNWVYHLLSTTPSECSLEDRKKIAQLLLTVLRSEEVMAVWIGRQAWSFTTASIRSVRKWWEDEEVVASLSEEERGFISATEADPITTFEPVVMFCAKKWLCEKTWNACPVAAVVWSYQSLQKGKEVDFLETFDPSAAELIEAAEFGGMEKTALWYRRCAIALREVGHLDSALEYFTKALELDPNEWLTRPGMAMTCKLQHNYQQAIEYDEEAAKLISQAIADAPEAMDLKLGIHAILERLGDSYKQLGNLDKWHECFAKAYQSTPYCNTCINALLEHYHKAHEHQAIIDLLRHLADTPVPDEDYSRLTQTVWLNSDCDDPFLNFALAAALETGTLSLMVEAWRVAARTARRALKTVTAANIELGLARIYSEFLHDQAQAVKRWEAIMNTYVSSADETQIGLIKLQAAHRLSQHYLAEAVNAGTNTPEADEAATKLEKLVAQVKCDGNSFAYILQSASGLALAVYHRLKGQHSEARALVRPVIKAGIQILSDDDPENDQMGLINLLTALLAAGDTKSILAVAYAMGAREEKADGETADEDEEEDELRLWTCDGPCHREWSVPDDISLCTICFDSFCADCTKMLAEGTMAINRCSGNHVSSFVYVPPRPQPVAKGAVVVDGEEMEFEAWKELLRKEWEV